jgi:hypothetical protein
VGFIALATFIKTNQNPNSESRREAPTLTIWVLCPNKNGDIYNSQKCCHTFVDWYKNHFLMRIAGQKSSGWAKLPTIIYSCYR